MGYSPWGHKESDTNERLQFQFHFAPWNKRYDQTSQYIKKQRYYFATNAHLVKAMVFPVVMYGCESWTKKKAEH